MSADLLDTAVKTAQYIVDQDSDIRPQLFKGKKVVEVQRGTEQPPSAVVIFSDDTTTRFTGLYAKEILKRLPKPVIH